MRSHSPLASRASPESWPLYDDGRAAHLETLRIMLFASSPRWPSTHHNRAVRSHNKHLPRPFVRTSRKFLLGPSEKRSNAQTGAVMRAPDDYLDELLVGPIATFVKELVSPTSNLTVTSSTAAKCIDVACAYAGTTSVSSPSSSPKEEIALQDNLKRVYSALHQKGILQAFGSCSDALKPLQYTLTPEDLERATGRPLAAFRPAEGGNAFVVGTTAALGVAYASEKIGFDPRLVGGAIAAAIATDSFALNGAISETIARTLRPGYRDTVILHEAGHFLVAYLLGNPIQSCLLDPLAVKEEGRFNGVTAGTVFFDPELGGGMISGRLSRACIDRYTIVAMAGIAAEAMANGKSEGGKNDENALIQLLASLDQGRSWDLGRIQTQARWAGTQAFLLIRDHQSAYKALVEALGRGASTGESIMAIESALSGSPLPSVLRKQELVDVAAQQESAEGSQAALSQVNLAVAQEKSQKNTEDVAARLAKNAERLAEIDGASKHEQSQTRAVDIATRLAKIDERLSEIDQQSDKI